MKRILILSVLFLFTISTQAAKGNKDLVTIQITPDHYDWNYKVGETARFTISLFQDQQKLKNVKIEYKIGPEKMPPTQKDSVLLKDGTAVIKTAGLRSPGFLSCEVRATIDGFPYRNLINIAYDCEKIQPTTLLPKDFRSFWDSQISRMREYPMQSEMTFIPEESDADVKVYRVKISHYSRGNYLYGVLCIPNKEGRFPAVLRLPGAGVAKHTGDKELARMGVITFRIGIHGIPLDLKPEAYANLQAGALKNYMYHHMDNREEYYYNRVFLGCIRANDFIASLPQYDGENLAAYGGSQGGALTLVTAVLDSTESFITVHRAALSTHSVAVTGSMIFSPEGSVMQLVVCTVWLRRATKAALAAAVAHAPVVKPLRSGKKPGARRSMALRSPSGPCTKVKLSGRGGRCMT